MSSPAPRRASVAEHEAESDCGGDRQEREQEERTCRVASDAGLVGPLLLVPLAIERLDLGEETNRQVTKRTESAICSGAPHSLHRTEEVAAVMTGG